MNDLIKKIEEGHRPDFEEGLALYGLDLFTLGKLADKIKRARYGNKVFFNVNRHVNPTNVCADHCKFCGFSVHRKNPNPYTLGKEEILETVAGAVQRGVREVHVVGAHNPELTPEWYFDLFRSLKAAHPELHLKAMTAAEVDFMHRRFGLSYEEVLGKMADAGVDSMPGGGAEIFDEQVREFICKGKVGSADWLKIHGLWHGLGKKSNATMLFGHVEERKHRIDHILRLREQQDQSGGFNAFIPLVYQRENNFLKVEHFATGNEILKTMAVSRILLDNIPHVKAYWVTSTVNLALVACEFGADDLDGTIEKESINAASGAASGKGMAMHELVALARNAGFTPVERDSLYNEIKVWE